MRKIMNLTFESSIADLCEVNQSFDHGVIRIAYVGENRNKTFISKDAFEKALPTIYNCPVVCNYDISTDTLGGHDLEIVSDTNGELKVINATSPIGCIPESAKVWFEDYTDENGVKREYLYAEALLWKRQAAYQKIKQDGFTNQSMEIAVLDGESIDGLYHINDFEFTAFTAIGVEPCFEDAAIQVFSQQTYKEQLSEMMNDLRASFNLVNTPDGDDNTHPQNYMKGETETLNDKVELATEYGIDVNDLDFSIGDFSIEELKEKCEAMKMSDGIDQETSEFAASEETSEADAQEESADENKTQDDNIFALASNVREELRHVLGNHAVSSRWGEELHYWLLDYDQETMEVFVEDPNDGLLYSMKFATDGDSVIVDFENKKRVKAVFVEFKEGESEDTPNENVVFDLLEKKSVEYSEVLQKYEDLEKTHTALCEELTELRKFKTDVEAEDKAEKISAVFAQFEDIADVDAFKELQEHADEYELDVLEEKCFAIRGKYGAPMNFSLNNGNTPKIKIKKTNTSQKKPYGGLVEKYLGDID